MPNRLLVPVILIVLVGALGALAGGCAGDDEESATPAAAATAAAIVPPPLSGAGSQPTPTPPPAATATPLPATPAPALPPPVLPGFPTIPLPAISPDREIVDAVNRNGPAYSAAMTRQDESPLATVFTGEALAAYSEEVAKERAKPQRAQNALLEISMVSFERTGTTANVKTRERWRFQVGNSCSVHTYDEFYQVALVEGRWMIAKNQFVRAATEPC